MVELIDRQAALDDLCTDCKSGRQIPCPIAGKCNEYNVIKRQPIIEQEVRHGHWIKNTFCSNCKRFPVDVSVSISNRELTKYFSWCPHCGAKMDRGANNTAHIYVDIKDDAKCFWCGQCGEPVHPMDEQCKNCGAILIEIVEV